MAGGREAFKLHTRPELRACVPLKLRLNPKTQIIPLKNGADFWGFHTYLTKRGKIIHKVRHESSKRMKRKASRLEGGVPEGGS